MSLTKAHVIRGWAEPLAFQFEDVPEPAARPAPGQLLISVHTVNVAFGDTLVASGRYQVRPVLPFVPGMKCSGVVEAVGAGVTGYAPGDHVAASGFIGDSRVDRITLGALAERISVPTENAVRAPKHIPLEQLASFRSSNETSYYGLQRGRLQRGDTLVVMGAGGATGYAAVELGKRLGAHVIASASSEPKRALAMSAGADVVIDSHADDWRDQIKQLTDGSGIDVVFDPVGGDQTERAFRSLAWGGRLVVIGFAAGHIPAIPANLALLKGASMVGANLLEAKRNEPERIFADRVQLMEWLREGKLTVPPVGARYSFPDALKAHKAAASGQVVGSIVVTVGG
jgi:NADPH2:quinone reductase